LKLRLTNIWRKIFPRRSYVGLKKGEIRSLLEIILRWAVGGTRSTNNTEEEGKKRGTQANIRLLGPKGKKSSSKRRNPCITNSED